MELDEAIVKLLGELAFIAGGYGMIAESSVIVDGLQKVRPGSAQPYLIQAMTQLNASRADEAERVLRENALTLEPDSSMAKALLGVALHMQGRLRERDDILSKVISSGDEDEHALNIAKDLYLRTA